ncbi:hypothetical protein FRX31_017422 [Thalictrum thalictroides]|uniref:Ubiquitin-like domain-containing protein n=1 Tax=Thalictrum thalictroides TaxID=46969 RepID=A0A7J6W9D0_THATH|nr:hypothetical protein FRX31_017422 [Thalictrum thalictroides]
MENIVVEFNQSGERHVIQEVETIGDMKNRIKEECKIEVNEQILQYQEYLMLDNDKKIASLLDIKSHKKMTLHIKKAHQTEVQVDIICKGPYEGNVEELTIPAFCGQTVLTLKQQINKKLGFGPFRQTLTTCRKVMNDTDFLRDYIVTDRPTFIVTIAKEGIPKNFVFIESKNKQDCFPLAKEDTIYTLEHRYREKHKLAPDYNFVLTWQGQMLSGPKTLRDYTNKDNAVIEFSEVNSIT